MTDAPLPQADQAPGAPHPRDTAILFGQDEAERGFLEAVASDRLHHAWLLAGPKGVGKATLAWRIARFLLAREDHDGQDALFGAPPPPTSLDVSPDHPVARRMASGAEGRLFLLRRSYDEKTQKFSAEIRVDEARKLKNFFALSSADGGHRVVIVDAADELNTSAANALLKILEEPPADTTLLLVSHHPSGLLPTIRSRCRTLRCSTLSPEAMAQALAQAEADLSASPLALSELSQGSVGAALRLLHLDGLETYAKLTNLFSKAPGLDRAAAISLADSVAGRGKADHLAQMVALIETFLARAARLGATGAAASEAAPGEAATLARLSPTPAAARQWADLQQKLVAKARHAMAVNLDPSALILDMILKVDETASQTTTP